MLSIAGYGGVLFERAMGYGKEISLEYKELARIVNALKSPMVDIETDLYLYTLVLSDSQKRKTRLYIEEVLFQLEDLKHNDLIKHSELLKRDVTELVALSLKIKSFAETVFAMTRRERYPALSYVSDHLGPNNENFIAAFQIADYEAEELISEPAQFEIKNVLSNLRYAWGQMVSSTRILIASRTGVFGNPDIAMRVVDGNLETYSRLVDSLITQLEQFQQKGLLGMQQSNVLPELRRLQTLRESSTREMLKILNSDEWRQDIPILLNQIKPLFEKTHGAITLIERRLESLTANNLQKSTEATATLSNFLWLFSGFVVVLFLLLYLVFEFWLMRPIINISKAIDSVGAGKNRVSVRNTGLEEIDDLVLAFHKMQLQISSRQQRLTSILENAGESILTIDDMGVVESFNQAAEDLFGYKEKDIVGKNIKLLMPQPYRDEHDGYLQRYRDNSGSSRVMGIPRELKGQKKDGTVFPLDLTTSVIFLDGERKFIGVIQDITEHKTYEMELKSAKEKAETSLEQLTKAQSQLVEAEKMASLGGLVAGVAHEINTPIGIGVTAASHMIEEIKQLTVQLKSGELTQTSLEEFCEETKDASTILLNNLNRAADLVRSFKQVAVDQSSEGKREFNVAEYLGEILLNLRPQLKKTMHQIQIDCPQDVIIKSYPGAFSQIITNLVQNSLVHAFKDQPKGEISIKVSQETTGLVLQYADNGAGMTTEIVKRIYDPFFTTRRKDGGSGLGLHIVFNLIAQTLHGQIRCDSTPGSGTRFTIDIPL